MYNSDPNTLVLEDQINLLKLQTHYGSQNSLIWPCSTKDICRISQLRLNFSLGLEVGGSIKNSLVNKSADNDIAVGKDVKDSNILHYGWKEEGKFSR